MVGGSKGRTELLIDLGGGAAVAKVRKEWLDNNDVQTQVRKVAYSFATEWIGSAICVLFCMLD
jgi:hypothetical protein